ncbi:MAG: hypothetical protein JXR30_02300 [Alphaproteobacteria bacterium]|nr:hypothetical protein [Alphaproteobacteria bacterium]
MTEASRLHALFRQIHVIEGGVKTFNQEIKNVSDDVFLELAEYPSGEKLQRHIQMLRDSQIKENQISRENVPFEELIPEGEIIEKSLEIKKVMRLEKSKILKELEDFSPDTAHLTQFQKDFGLDWKENLKTEVRKQNSFSLDQKLKEVMDFAEALDAWYLGEEILQENNQVKARAKLKEIETHLKKFGEAGEARIQKIKTLALLS